MTIEDTDERTYHQLLIDFHKGKRRGYANVALPDGSTILLRFGKMCDAWLHGDRPAFDVGLAQDCTVFFVASGYPRNRRGADEEVLVLLHPTCRSPHFTD